MPILAKKIFLDEAQLDLDGYVNKQNCRIWGTENPHAYIEKMTHPKRVTVCCGFRSRGIIGPFFFEQGEAHSVNGDHYGAMLNEFLYTKIEKEDIGNICFQQDSATWHAAVATHDVWRPLFEDRIISRRADVVWPPRSCDLKPLNYLWGAVKDKFYADKPKRIDALKNNICEAIGEIQLLAHNLYVLKNWTDRAGATAWPAEPAI